MTIIWCMVPEIRSMTDRNFCHFWLFFALLPLLIKPKIEILKKKITKCSTNEDHMTILKKWRSDVWFLIYGAWQTDFLVILNHFLHFYPLTTQTIRDIIILHMCTINYNHMMYGSWDIECNRIFCHFGPLFANLPSNSPKNENFKKMKKMLETSSFYKYVPKIIIICYTVPEIWHVTDVIVIVHVGLFFCEKRKFQKNQKKFLQISSSYTSVPKIIIICYNIPEKWCVTDVIFIFHFGLFLPFYLPNSPKNQNFKKNEINTWRCHHFTHVYQKLWLDDVQFLRYAVQRTDRQMDGKSYL